MHHSKKDIYDHLSGVQNPCWLIIGDCTTLHILGIRIIQEQGIPINQPGLNGMIEGF